MLYGNVSSGGVINLVKKKPLDYDYFSAQGSAGKDKLFSLAADFNKAFRMTS